MQKSAPVQGGAHGSTTVPSKPATSPSARSADRPRTMLDAAFELIAHHGLQKLTLTALSKATGSKVALEGRALRSRSELMLVLLDDCQAAWSRLLTQSLKRGLRGEFALIHLFERIAAQFGDQGLMRGRLVLFFEIAACRDSDLTKAALKAQASIQNGLIAILNDGIRSGHFRSTNVKSLAVIVNGACRGIGYQWLLDPDSINVRAALRELENLLVRALESP